MFNILTEFTEKDERKRTAKQPLRETYTKTVQSPAFSSKVAREIFKPSITVGPGAYDANKPKRRNSGPTFPETTRFSNKKKTEGPGPGQYHDRFTFKKEGGPIISTKERRFRANLNEKNPSPQTYEMFLPWGNRSFNLYQMFGVSSGRMPQKSDSIGPGPAGYRNIKKKYHYGAKIGTARRFSQGSEIIGPGLYEVNKPMGKKSFNVNWLD